MKKVITAIVFLMSSFVYSQAQAMEAPAWTCELNFKATAKGVQFILGSYNYKGKGTLRCLSAFGEVDELPIKIKIGSGKIAPRLAIGKTTIYGLSANISLLTGDPENLLGKYRVLNVHGSVFAGAGAFTAVKIGMPSLSLTVSAQVTKGYGLNLGLNTMKLELDD